MDSRRLTKHAASIAVIAATALLTGCAHKLHFNCSGNHYDLDAAVSCVNRLRTDMQGEVKKLDRTTQGARVGILAGGLAAAGGALYKAHRDFIVGATAVGFGSYTVGNLYSPPPIMTVYHNGIDATRCVRTVASGAAASVADIRARRDELSVALASLHRVCPDGVCPAANVTPPAAATAPTDAPREARPLKKPEARALPKPQGTGGRDPLGPKPRETASTGGTDQPVASTRPDTGGGASTAASSTVRDPAATYAKGRQLWITSAGLLDQPKLASKIVDAVHKIADTVDKHVADHTPTLDAFLNASQSILSAARGSVPDDAPAQEKSGASPEAALRGAPALTDEQVRAIDEVEAKIAKLQASIAGFGDTTALGTEVGECAKLTSVAAKPLIISPANTEVTLTHAPYDITVREGQPNYHGRFSGQQPASGEIRWWRTGDGKFRFQKMGDVKQDYTFVIWDDGRGDKRQEATVTFKASKKESGGGGGGSDAAGGAKPEAASREKRTARGGR